MRASTVRVPPAASGPCFLVAATRPGGWLLLDDVDHTTPPLVLAAPDPDTGVYPTAVRHALTTLSVRGLHLAWPSTLPGRLLRHGVSGLVATWNTPTTTGGDPDSGHHRALLTTALRHDPSHRVLHERALRLLADPGHTATGPTVLTVRARTPLAPAYQPCSPHPTASSAHHHHRWTRPRRHASVRRPPALTP